VTADPVPKTIRTATGIITNGPAEEPERIGRIRIPAVYRSAGSVAMPLTFLLAPVGLAIPVPAFAYLGAVLVDAEPAFQFLGAALLLRRLVPFTLLLA
jgi:hypothetical protein